MIGLHEQIPQGIRLSFQLPKLVFKAWPCLRSKCDRFVSRCSCRVPMVDLGIGSQHGDMCETIQRRHESEEYNVHRVHEGEDHVVGMNTWNVCDVDQCASSSCWLESRTCAGSSSDRSSWWWRSVLWNICATEAHARSLCFVQPWTFRRKMLPRMC